MNFNFGEHYYEGSPIWLDLLVTVIGGLIAFGTALWFYYRQNKHDKLKEVKDIDDEYMDILNYIKLLIEGVIITIEEQNQKSIEFGNNVKANLAEIEQLTIIASRDIDRLQTIDSLKIFLTFRHRFSKELDWIKDFQKLYGHIDFVYAHLHELASVYGTYRDGTYNQLIRFKAIVDNLPDLMADMCLEIKRTVTDYENDEGFTFLENSIKKYRALADNDAKVIKYDSDFLVY